MKSARATMAALEKIAARKSTLNLKLTSLDYDEIAIVRQFGFKCDHCNQSSALCAWKFIQRKYYVPPRGYTEGDCWVRSCADLCCLVCPKCENRNYIYTHPQKKVIMSCLNSIGDRQKIFTAEIVIEEESPERD